MMELIKEIFLQNVFTSVKAAVIIILLFILTKPITKRYTAGFRYYSWLAVMIIFLIPFAELGAEYQIDITPAVTNISDEMRGVRSWYEKNVPEYSVSEEYNSYERIESKTEGGETEYVPVVKTASAKKKLDLTAVFALLYVTGAFAYFILHCGRYAYFRRSLRRLSNAVNDERILAVLDEERQRLKIAKRLDIRVTPVVDTPMLAGLFKPQIILPRLDYADDELRLILRHELFHFKRKDILYQLVTLVFVSLHWFDPVVHIMARAIETDGETSCDEKTLEGRSYNERIFYGEMLLKFLKTETQKRSYMTTTFFGGKKGMKKRLTLIASKKARRRGTAAMVIVMLAAIITSLSAAAMGNEYFETIFEGDTSYLADFVKTEKKSVEDDRFKLTLEQYLVAEKQAVLILSFEAKTEDAVQEMYAVDERGHSTFSGIDFINFVPTDFEKADIGGDSIGSLGGGKFDTENKRYFKLCSDCIENEEEIDFRLSTDRIKDSPKIIVPMKHNLETSTVQFAGMTMEYNPISFRISYPEAALKENDCEWCSDYGRDFFFRMKNGEIKTFTQLYDHSGGDSDYDENDNRISTTMYAWAKGVIKPGEIKSIIVNDTEYPLDDPSKPAHVEIDKYLKPFEMEAYVKEHLWAPLRELCDGIGAEIKWDGDTNSAKVSYRGSEYVFTVGSTVVQIDGEPIDFYDDLNDNTTFIDERGRMIVSARVSDYMDIDIHGYNYHDEDGNIKSDAKLHVIP